MSQAGSNSSGGGGGGGDGILELQGNAGSVIPPNGSGIVTLNGSFAGHTVQFYGNFEGTEPNQMDLIITDNNQNTYLGLLAGGSGTDDGNNTTLGYGSMASPNAAFSNVAIGHSALSNATDAGTNVAIGQDALLPITNGSSNIGIGYNSGGSFSGSEQSNIVINNTGVSGESNVLRIGAASGTGDQQINASFIYGIFGRTVGGSGIPMVIDNASQLGTVVSSAKYKENIKDIPAEISSKISELKPVMFNYIADKDKSLVYGLVAEEVEKIFPEMVAKDLDGETVAVKYQDLPILMLNELIALKKEVAELKALISKE